MRFFWMAILLSFIFSSQALGTEGSQTLRAYRLSGVEIEEIFYESLPYKGVPVHIFGYFCHPIKFKGKLPAVLLVHGGGGSASLNRSIILARKGYAVLAIDLPGKGEKRAGSRSTGPDMDVANLLNAKAPFENNYLVNAVAATRNAITYLAQRKEVDPSRIGMVGLSWGGVITLLTNGQDDRLKAAVNVFGAGYIPEGCTWQDWFTKMSSEEITNWDNSLDPKNFLKSQHAPILFITGTNDHCYYLPTFQKSYNQVPVEKELCLIPNLRHQFFEAEQAIVWRWIDIYLKEGGSFPAITQLPGTEKDGKIKLTINASVSGEARITRATLYYSLNGPSYWTKKRWHPIPGQFKKGVFSFLIPSTLVKPEILYFISVFDTKGGISSTPVRSLFKIKAADNSVVYAQTAPLEKTYQHPLPLELLTNTSISLEASKLLFDKKNNCYQLQK
ncbi:MAG: alpha/beta fold hydrolase [Candidatus Margulisiibacteriota bacterium]